MSIIESLKTYFAQYDGLEDGSPLYVDFLGETPVSYSIVPLAGTKVLQEYIDGSKLCAYPFAFQSVESTADELARIASFVSYETLSDWFDTQTDAEDLPDLGTGKTAESIEALNWAYLFQQGSSDTGVYQIQAVLRYKQAAS
jgi:hypothetical protein